MYRGYPVGELMFWDVPANGETRAIGERRSVRRAHQIVDGQQRLTSLYRGNQGSTGPRRELPNEENINIAFNPFTEKFEVRTPAIAKSPQWVEDISTVLRLAVDGTQRQFVMSLPRDRAES